MTKFINSIGYLGFVFLNIEEAPITLLYFVDLKLPLGWWKMTLEEATI